MANLQSLEIKYNATTGARLQSTSDKITSTGANLQSLAIYIYIYIFNIA